MTPSFSCPTAERAGSAGFFAPVESLVDALVLQCPGTGDRPEVLPALPAADHERARGSTITACAPASAARPPTYHEPARTRARGLGPAKPSRLSQVMPSGPTPVQGGGLDVQAARQEREANLL